MFNLGMGEITIILLLAMIFLGPKKLPELASGLGKLIREIRKTTSDVKNEIQLDDAIRKPFEELRDAVTLHPDELKRRDRLRRELADLHKRAQETSEALPAEPGSGEEALPPQGATNTDTDTGIDTGTADIGATSDETATAAAGSPVDPGGEPATAATLGSDTGSGSATVSAESANALPTVAPDQAASMVTPPPSLLGPGIPGAAPVGTVSREPSAPVTPPAPPLAAVLAKGAVTAPGHERRAAVPPTGSDFLRSLRAVPEGGRRPIPGRTPAEPLGAADRNNITQTLTEADLAGLTVGPPTPPPPPVQGSGRTTLPPPPPSTSPRLPGATPPKNPNH